MRSLVAGTPRDGVPELVVVPGLGALGYLVPTVRACAAWTRVHLLDLPGFGSRRTAHLPADVASVAATVSAWLSAAGLAPVTLLGHSTGAQAALRAGVQSPELLARLVLAGATFAPRDRALGPLVRDVGRTLLHERPGELPAVLPYYLRGAGRLPALLRSSLADRPEDRVGDVRPPVLVLHGRHDRLCPPAWAGALAQGARKGRAVVLPGAHNTVWTDAEPTARALRAAGT